MRKNETTRNVIIFLVVAALASYVLMGFGSNRPQASGDTITKIGTSKIKLGDALIQKENIRSAFEQYKQPIERDMLNNYTVAQLIRTALLLDGANRLHIGVSDEELRDYVIEMRTDPDGQYVNEEQWAQFIKYRFRVQVESYEDFLREKSLKTSKFQNLFLDSTFVPESEVRERYVADNKKVKLEMLVLNTYEVKSEINLEDDAQLTALMTKNPDAFKTGPLRQARYIAIPLAQFQKDVEISDAQIEAYYNERIEQYRTPEQVKASHILIKSDGRTDEEALAKITKIRAEIEAGLDFAEAAKKYSEDASNAPRGGDLGYFRRRQMVPAFDEAAFTMEIGELSAPIKTQFGYHLIKKIDYKPEVLRPLSEVSAAIRGNLVRDTGREKAQAEAAAFKAKLDAGTDFEAAASESGYEIYTSDFFDNDPHSALGGLLKTNYQARRSISEIPTLNAYTEPFSTNQHMVVAQWIAEAEPKPLDMANDKARIKTLASDLAGELFIKDLFASCRKAAANSPGKTFKELLADRSFLKDNHFKTTEFIGKNMLPYEIVNANLDFETEIFDLEPGTFLPDAVTPQANRYTLARLVDKQEANLDTYADNRAQIVETIRRENGEALLNTYIYSRNKSLDPHEEKRNRLLAMITL
jgi:peptidyl-prolyl cis-trans isomerase D